MKSYASVRIPGYTEVNWGITGMDWGKGNGKLKVIQHSLMR